MLEMSEHTKNMYNPAYEKGFLFGKQWWSNYERKRIIKLLENWISGLLSDHDLPNVVIRVREFDAVIELIKGETKWMS
jgi:hypothetical protein